MKRGKRDAAHARDALLDSGARSCRRKEGTTKL